MHGTPVAYIAGRSGFDAFPPFPAPIPAEQICLFGIRSVDTAEHEALLRYDIAMNDMRVLDERGIVAPARVSWSACAPPTGCCMSALTSISSTPRSRPPSAPPFRAAPQLREAHLVCELLHESGLMSSLDLVELNPFWTNAGAPPS